MWTVRPTTSGPLMWNGSCPPDARASSPWNAAARTGSWWNLLQKLSHRPTWRRFLLERELFCSMKVDCAMPVGIHADFPRKGEVRMGAMVDGRKAFRQGRAENHSLLAASLKEELYDGK